MKLYKITQDVETATRFAIDDDTGEIIDDGMLEILDDLKIKHEVKCLDIACVIKGLTYQEKAIKEEMNRLAKNKKSTLSQIDWLKDYLINNIEKGAKFSDTRATIGWRKSKKIIVEDPLNLPTEFQKISIDAKRTELKKHLEAGNEIEGVSIEESQNIQIK